MGGSVFGAWFFRLGDVQCTDQPRFEVTVSGQTSLFISCFNDFLFPESVEAAVRVLRHLDVQVSVPKGQTCCGQIHYNTGYGDMAIPLVRAFVDRFKDFDAVISISGSCTAMVREQYQRLAYRTNDQKLIKATEDLSKRIFEFTDYLTKVLGIESTGSYYPHRVTYHPTCHSLRSLHIYESALKLLRNVKGLELVELPHAEQCCGFGGTFSVKNEPVSTAMLFDKMANIEKTGAETLVALDNSCLMHIGGGLRRINSGISVMHIAEVLASGLDRG